MNVKKAAPQKLHPQLQKLDNKLKQAAGMYEKQFLRQMVKAMRSSVSHSSMTKPGMAESIYREQLDDQTVDRWVEGGGTGFSEIIYNDLVEKFYPMLKGPRKIKQVRPMAISDRFQGAKKLTAAEKANKQTYQLDLAAKTKAGKSYLQIPWQGKFEKSFEMGDGKTFAQFSHPDGLKSAFVFQGVLEPRLLNKSLNAGENFAQLGPESQSITWQIMDADSRKGSSDGEKKSFN